MRKNKLLWSFVFEFGQLVINILKIICLCIFEQWQRLNRGMILEDIEPTTLSTTLNEMYFWGFIYCIPAWRTTSCKNFFSEKAKSLSSTYPNPVLLCRIYTMSEKEDGWRYNICGRFVYNYLLDLMATETEMWWRGFCSRLVQQVAIGKSKIKVYSSLFFLCLLLLLHTNMYAVKIYHLKIFEESTKVHLAVIIISWDFFFVSFYSSEHELRYYNNKTLINTTVKKGTQQHQ